MKSTTFILALFMFIKPVLPILEYVVFYDYIKTELCVNKENLELKCNGKCHLAKEMQKAADSQEKDSAKKQFSVESHVVFCQEVLENFIHQLAALSCRSKITAAQDAFAHQAALQALFRPPIFI